MKSLSIECGSIVMFLTKFSVRPKSILLFCILLYVVFDDFCDFSKYLWSETYSKNYLISCTKWLTGTYVEETDGINFLR